MNLFSQGDRNNKFFQKMANIRNVSKQISMLKCGDAILTTNADLDSHIVDYYERLFRGDNGCIYNRIIEEVISNVVSADDDEMLTCMPSVEEIREVVFAMNTDGSPGPDGFGAFFFQYYWSIVAHDVVQAMQQFFRHGWFLPNFNSNLIILILKVAGADSIEHFRPIALTNFKFKIITKVLADRLAKVIPSIISENQKGFIKGRHIEDCICLASEAINLLDKRSYGGKLL